MRPRITPAFVLRICLSLAATGAVLLPLFLADHEWPVLARNYLEAFGESASGAKNMVSAIYLGYRAFDTLGETIVLLVAVSGTIGIISHAGAVLTKGYDSFGTEAMGDTHHSADPNTPRRVARKQRTDLLEVVTGKLGPIVLVFGVYVMMYGHLSPGGGFQGGVVIASGIVFLALGNRVGATNRLTEPKILARIEALAFLLLVLASLSGIAFGGGFFDNPLQVFGVAPVGFIMILNAIIGLKVGAGIGFMCIAMMGRVE
jgi:multicomponent Na+:H+ antiporter subunit B